MGCRYQFPSFLRNKRFISLSMACFQASTNIASSYDLGIDIEEKEIGNWRKEG